MMKDEKEIPVFLEKEIDIILNRLGLLEKFNKNELKCYFCDVLISRENFGCVFLTKENRMVVCCSNPECFEKVSMEISDNG